jgi:GR25 family glycosyltransferase involved in LPS biosynthesis
MREAFSYFDKIFVINLDKRKDRLERCNQLFAKHNITDLVERFPGIVPDPSEDIPYTRETEKIKVPVYGCILSHLNIIKRAKAEGLKSVLVLEDDVDFINIDCIDKAIDQLKRRDWSLFYLGSNTHTPLQKADENLVTLKKGYSTHAIAYHETFYDFFIESFNRKMIKILDVWLSDYGQEHFKTYCANPITAIQVNSYSDIQNTFADYSWMEGKFKQNTKHI